MSEVGKYLIGMRQLEQFNAVWKNVRRNTTFWGPLQERREFLSYIDFCELPELRKVDVIGSIDSLMRSDMTAVSVVSTGGSTGTPLRLPVGAEGAARTRAKQAEGRLKYGVHYRDRCFLIWGHSNAIGKGLRPLLERWKRLLKDWLVGYYRLSAYDLGVSVLQSKFADFVRFKPKWLCGYSSAVVAFARANSENQKQAQRTGLKMVLCSAERLNDEEAAELEAFFGAPIALEYGSVEFGPIAYTHPQETGMYVMDDLLVEAIPTDRPSIYRLLVTSLYDRVVPLIRYDIGDEVRISDPDFQGGVITRFDEVYGRSNDIITFMDGTAVHSETLTHAVKGLDSVLNFQFHKWDDRMELVLVTHPNAKQETLEQEIQSKLCSLNTNFNQLNIRYADDVEISSAGKRRWIIDHTGGRL